MTGAKIGALATTALVIMYIAILGERGVLLLGQQSPVAKIMGGLILVFPLLALWGIARELIFGVQIEKLAESIEREGRWPNFEFKLRPSGRPERESALAEFGKYQELAQQSPDDFHVWFALGLAYDATGDRRRARAAMRKALALSKQPPAPKA